MVFVMVDDSSLGHNALFCANKLKMHVCDMAYIDSKMKVRYCERKIVDQQM